MLIADSEGDGHRNDAAHHSAPEGIDELLVVVEEQDHFVAASRPELLQMKQNSEGALVKLAEGDAALALLAFEISNAARDVAIGFNEPCKRCGSEHQRRSSLMYKGCRVRRLICASSATGSAES